MPPKKVAYSNRKAQKNKNGTMMVNQRKALRDFIDSLNADSIAPEWQLDWTQMTGVDFKATGWTITMESVKWSRGKDEDGQPVYGYMVRLVSNGGSAPIYNNTTPPTNAEIIRHARIWFSSAF